MRGQRNVYNSSKVFLNREHGLPYLSYTPEKRTLKVSHQRQRTLLSKSSQNPRAVCLPVCTYTVLTIICQERKEAADTHYYTTS